MNCINMTIDESKKIGDHWNGFRKVPGVNGCQVHHFDPKDRNSVLRELDICKVAYNKKPEDFVGFAGSYSNYLIHQGNCERRMDYLFNLLSTLK